jgi:hypothetical protein
MSRLKRLWNLLPAMLLSFDKVICYTTVGMKDCAKGERR